jgi:O-antigen ligase
MRTDAPSASIDRLAYIAVGVSILAITWNGLRFGGGAVANAFLVPAFAMVAVRTVVLRKPIPLPPWMFAAAIGFVIAALLNLIFPPSSSLMNDILVHYRTIPQVGQPLVLAPRNDMLTLAQFEIGVIVLPILIASVADTPRRIERLLDVFVFGAAINAFIGLIDWAGFHISPIQAGVGRSAGLTVHPNYLALTCTIAIPLALLWIGRGGNWRKVGFAATGLLLIGAYVSGSRAGAVTAVLGLVATMIVVPRLRPGLGFTVPAAGLVLLALFFFAGNQILQQIRLSNDVSTAVNTTGSDSQRSQLKDLAINQFESRPVQGVGFSVIADAHSIYLQLLAAGGVIAFLSFLIYIGGLASSAWRARAGPQRDIAAAISVSIGMWLLNGVIDNQLGDKYLFVVPGLLIALSYVAMPAKRPAEVDDQTPESRSGGQAVWDSRLLSPEDAVRSSP